MDYKHDIFFSYKRDSLTLDWHRWVKDRLVHWLTQEVGGRRIDCFMDEQITVGQHWPDSLQQALRHSRCLVGVWSPEYFQSEWCVSEWKTFVERERVLRRPGLIAPLQYHDGEHFPDEARSVEWMDVRNYTSTAPAFYNTVRAVELEDKIKEFARGVAQLLYAAPAFDPGWPVVPAPALPAAKIGLPRL